MRPEDIVILDNLGSHKVPAFGNAIKPAVALPFLKALFAQVDPGGIAIGRSDTGVDELNAA